MATITVTRPTEGTKVDLSLTEGEARRIFANERTYFTEGKNLTSVMSRVVELVVTVRPDD